MDAIPLHCPRCGADFGRVVEHRGVPHIDDGVMLVKVGIRRCSTCRFTYHWHGPQHTMEELRRPRPNGTTARVLTTGRL